MSETGSTLLAHLVTRITGQAEVLATEALCYILNRSDRARSVMRDIANTAEVKIAGSLSFSAQEKLSSKERPDLTGRENGAIRVFVELKFNAGLTEAQPVSYLKELPTGLLLVVAPDWRRTILWVELMKRCQEAGFKLWDDFPKDGSTSARWTNGAMVLVTWSDLINRLKASLANPEDALLHADVLQLEGLCRSMESEAFLPLDPLDLAPDIGRRMLNFCGLVDSAALRMKSDGRARLEGLRASGGRGWYGRYMVLDGWPCFLHVSSHRWSTWGQTPVWLEFLGPDWKAAPEAVKHFRPDGIHRFEEGQRVYLPLRLKIRAEEQEVLEDLITQIYKLIVDLPPAPKNVKGGRVQAAVPEE